MRDLTGDDRNAFTEAKKKRMGVVAGQGSCRVGEKTSQCAAKSHHPCTLGADSDKSR